MFSTGSTKIDYLIVGAGLFGSIFAHEMKKKGYSCLVIDKRNHIGGNCYTRKERGIDIHQYGPHIFHTNNKEIWDYINQFGEFNSFITKPKAFYKGKIYSLPINLMTLYQIYGVTNPQEAIAKINEVKEDISNPKNLEEWVLANVGKDIYEILIRGYTKKQWQRDPKNLPASIIKRLPVRYTFDENYFNDQYQGIPIDGYTALFEKMLDGIPVELETDFFKIKDKYKVSKIVYTGCIDQYFDYIYGKLDYRSLRFEQNVYEMNDFQGNAIINYTEESVPYTRIIEHKHFNLISSKSADFTCITKEYPADWGEDSDPYYPINDEKNTELYKKYKELAKNEKNVIFAGRLGSYRYFDMHQVVGQALELSKKEL